MLIAVILFIAAVVIGLTTQSNIANTPQAAGGCTHLECQLPDGSCLTRGNFENGFMCLGANRWKGPDNNVYYGSLPLTPTTVETAKVVTPSPKFNLQPPRQTRR